jgi:eukaryotic-like serine/threonine-protein kinase
MPKVGDVIAGKYQIEQLIGVGGMGAVFAANHKFTGKRVALKWMLPELARDNDAVQRFMREAHAAGRINHPNVVDVYDVGQHDSSYFLVMEHLSGETLTAALARRDMSPADLLDLLIPAMRGVGSAHRQGVVHRDLKPDNIFLSYEEDGMGRSAKVLDFGISKLSNEGTLDPRLTRTGAVVGTPYYMSPEQIRGLSGLDKRADVYAFGVILYEALTGRVPYHADTYGALVLEIATGNPPAPAELVQDVPVELSRIVMRAMARDPNARFPDMETLVRALEPFSSAQPRNSARRTSMSSSPNLEITHIAPPIATPPIATVPRLTSTPFTTESPATAKRKPVYTGPLMFGGAAALIVAGIWVATRGPEQPEDPPVIMPTRPIATQALQPTLPPPVAPVYTPPVNVVPPTQPPPTTGSHRPFEPTAPSTPTTASPATEQTQVRRPTGTFRQPESSSESRRPGRNRPPRGERAEPSAAPAQPVTSPPPTQGSKKMPRSGQLSQEEF